MGGCAPRRARPGADHLPQPWVARHRPGPVRELHRAESLALLDGLPLRNDLARVNFAYGQTLRRAGKRREADTVISTARDLYLSLGAHTYVQRCERELKAGGLHPMRGPRGQVELTPQEEAVTLLVAQAATSRGRTAWSANSAATG